jgi:hypothetical protein
MEQRVFKPDGLEPFDPEQDVCVTMNFMDPTVPTRELSRARLKVVAARFYPYTGNFAPAV